MSVRCDVCGTRKGVKRSFVSVWNGNQLDLCLRCAKPLIKVLDNLLKQWADR
jgi:hypothetical protein